MLRGLEENLMYLFKVCRVSWKQKSLIASNTTVLHEATHSVALKLAANSSSYCVLPLCSTWTGPYLRSYGSRKSRPARYPSPEVSVSLLLQLRNPIIAVHHVVSPSCSCLERSPTVKVVKVARVGFSFASGRRGRWWNYIYRLVATGMSAALQQGFCWGFILLRGWACIAPFCVTKFENVMRGFLEFVLYVFRLSLTHLWFCSMW
jgi:hypothetical protein